MPRRLDKTSIRIGSPQYQSYGLLTIRKKHIKIKGNTIILDFEGKSKQHWHLELYDKRLSELIKRFEKNSKYTIFKYFDENKVLQSLKVSDINDYLREATGENISAKDFRTWKGSLCFLYFIMKYKNKNSETIQRICIEKVAKKLFNTPRICKNSYIHPLLLQSNLEEKLAKTNNVKPSPKSFMAFEELKLLALLKKNND